MMIKRIPYHELKERQRELKKALEAFPTSQTFRKELKAVNAEVQVRFNPAYKPRLE